VKYTCAIAFTDGIKLLVCHPTGAKTFGFYSLPKGLSEKNESYIDAAIRELKEETFIKIRDKTKIKFLGEFEYNKDKKYILFKYEVDILPDINSLHCQSTFITKDGIKIPEVDRYLYITKDELYQLNKKQQKIIASKEILDEIFETDL